MKAHKRSFYFISGLCCFFAGVVLVILGNIWALILFLLGLGLLGAGFSLMLKTGGYSADGVYFHGLYGQGRQQSETVKLDSAVPAENADIWKRMEQSK